jgi:ligand-binding SRPBCC domain-containing protein
MPRTFVLEREQRVPRPRGEVFAFFADPANLEQLTPAFLRFSIATPGALAMAEGLLIEYRLNLFGLPFSWRTRIERYRPPEEFVDVQLSGPYRSWRHTHTFQAIGGTTVVRDRVEYQLPLGPLGPLARALFVRGSLERIFDFRREEIARRFGEG